MPYANPAKQKAAQAQWYQDTVRARRVEWLDKNGPCRKCGSSEKLEVDHVDPSQKVTHSVWTWAADRRNAELAKCQVLCEKCHLQKSILENPNTLKRACKYGHAFDLFNTHIRPDGTRDCRACSRIRSAKNRAAKAAA